MTHDWLTAIRRHLHKKVLIVYDEPPPRGEFEAELYENRRRLALDEFYLDWCRKHERDPDSGITAADYEEWFNYNGIEYDE